MKVATYNLWHSIVPQGWLAFSYLEPEGRRRLREQMQLTELKRLSTDLIFLQEVSPLTSRLKQFQSLRSTVHSCVDARGVKWFGLGFPLNLHSGLVTILNPDWSPRTLGGFKLSGGVGEFTGKYFSLQTRESRHALLSEFSHPTYGKTLCVNTHLHHATHFTAKLREQLLVLQKQKVFSERVLEELFMRLQEGEARRLKEVMELLNIVRGLKKNYELIILGGDFNITDQCKGYELIRDFGFQDMATQSPTPAEPTWNQDLNRANHRFLEGFPLAVFTDDLSFVQSSRQLLLDVIKKHEARPRRIDYIWLWQKSPTITVNSSQLFGLCDSEGLAGSDHFGLCMEWQ